MAWANTTASKTGSLVQGYTLYTDSAKQTRQHFTLQMNICMNGPNHKSNPRVSQGKEMRHSLVAKSATSCQHNNFPTEHAFQN